METLKNIFLIGFILLAANVICYGQQDFSKIQLAFKESYKLEASGDFKSAADKIKEVYREDMYESNLRLGWLNYMAGNFNESIAFYQNSINIMPFAEEPKFGYVFPLSALGRWDEVITVYNSILEISNHNTKALYYLGTIYYNRKQFDKALSYFKKITDLYPFDYDALYMHAWSNLQLGKKKEAKLLFQKALLNKPNDADAKNGLLLTN